MPKGKAKMQENLLFCSPCTNFAASEGRNPRAKNAFLALSYVIKSPILQGGMKREIRSFCFVYVRVQPHAVLS